MKNVFGFKPVGEMPDNIIDDWKYRFGIIQQVIRWDVGIQSQSYVVGGIAACLISDKHGYSQFVSDKDREAIDIDCIAYMDAEHPINENSIGIDALSRVYNLDAKNILLTQVGKNVLYGTDSSYTECSVNLNTHQMYATDGFLTTMKDNRILPPAWYGHFSFDEAYGECSENLWRPLFRIAYKGSLISEDIVRFLNENMNWHLKYRAEWVYGVLDKASRQFAIKDKVKEIVFNQENDFSDEWKDFILHCVPIYSDLSSPLTEYLASEARIRLYTDRLGPLAARGREYTTLGGN